MNLLADESVDKPIVEQLRQMGTTSCILLKWSRAFLTTLCFIKPMTMRLNPDYFDMFKTLNTANVRYLIIGGYAFGFHVTAQKFM